MISKFSFSFPFPFSLEQFLFPCAVWKLSVPNYKGANSGYQRKKAAHLASISNYARPQQLDISIEKQALMQHSFVESQLGAIIS